MEYSESKENLQSVNCVKGTPITIQLICDETGRKSIRVTTEDKEAEPTSYNDEVQANKISSGQPMFALEQELSESGAPSDEFGVRSSVSNDSGADCDDHDPSVTAKTSGIDKYLYSGEEKCSDKWNNNSYLDDSTLQDDTAIMKMEKHVYDLSEKDKVDKLLKFLASGCMLHKVKSGGILYPRKFYLDTENMVLKYTGSEKRFRKKNSSWPISKIREVREGEKDYSKRLDPFDRGRCFAVVFGANHDVLYLYADNTYDRDIWLKGLNFAMHMEQYMDQKEQTDRWIRDAFNMADKNNDGSLDFEEIMKLLKQLNADMDKKYVKQLFDKADVRRQKGTKPSLDSEEFVKFYHMLTERPEIDDLFIRYDGGKGFWEFTDLQEFSKVEQNTIVSEDQAKELIAAYEPQKQLQLEDRLSPIGFRILLASNDQQLFNPAHKRVYQNMDKPITQYYINSSHNTYLKEDQLTGPSRVEAYITALSMGCRCVELDCWDGSDDEPVIYHGYTLTSKISFRDVISAIKDYAFQASPYPVILSIENHCSVKQQAVMASYVRTILGDLLYVPEDDDDSIPSPHDLRGKVVLKGKKLPATVTGDEEGEVSDEDEAADVEQNATKEKKSSGHKVKLDPSFSACVGMKAISFKGVSEVLNSNGMFVSLGESKVHKMIEHNENTQINKMANHLLVRTYPAGHRTDSSNYNPFPMWNAGAQVVALNFQTPGDPMMLNTAKFLDNGGSGYLLKPQFFLSEDEFEKVMSGKRTTGKKKLSITVISGYQIPKPKDSKKGEVIDPFIKIEIHGTKQDTQSVKTSHIENNGFNPHWDEEVTFTISVPEIALVRFVVYDKDPGLDDFIGYFALPFHSIQEGYRHFPLYSKVGEKMNQTLIFIRTEIKDL